MDKNTLEKVTTIEENLPRLLRRRIKKEARDYECMLVLQKSNPALAKLCTDIDDIISGWALTMLMKHTNNNEEVN